MALLGALALVVPMALAIAAPSLLTPQAIAQDKPPTYRSKIHLPTETALTSRLRKGAELEALGRHPAAALIYIEILRAAIDPEAGKEAIERTGKDIYRSGAAIARERLLGFPPEARAAFQRRFDAEAGSRLTAALAAGDEQELSILARTLPLSSSAPAALEALGDRNYERGDVLGAATRYAEALSRLEGEAPTSEEAPGRQARVARLRKKSEAAALRSAKAARALQALPESGEAWPVAGGSPTHAGVGAPVPRIGPVPRYGLVHRTQAARHWGTRGQRLGGYTPQPGLIIGPSRHSWENFADVQPALSGDAVIAVSSRGISCFDVQTGATRWSQAVWTGPEPKSDRVIYGVTVAGGRAYASFISEVSRPEDYRQIPIKEAIPKRRLVCFDVRTGRRLWDHLYDPNPFWKRATVPMPPVEYQGRLYAGAVVREGQLKCYLTCVDAATGKLLWRRYLAAGQVEMTMFGEHAIEPLAMQPVVTEGLVLHCTAVGAIAACAADTGEIQWIRTYDTIPIQSARTYYAVERDLHWFNVPPIASEGVCVFAPLDSQNIYAYEAHTGKLRWLLPGESERRILGVHDGQLVLQGRRLRLIEVATGKLSRLLLGRVDQRLTQEEAGQGVIAGHVALVPLNDRIARVDLRTGRRLTDFPLAGLRESGSLVIARNKLVTASPLRINLFPIEPKGAPPSAPRRGENR
jgi:hypothetical protein